MPNIWNRIETLLCALAGTCVLMWTMIPYTVQILIGLMLLDVAIGITAAAINGEVDSHVSFRGMLKKGVILGVVGVSALLQGLLVDAGYIVPLIVIVATFYIINEVLSIIENVVRTGLPVPTALEDALAKVGRTKLLEEETVNVDGRTAVE